MWGCLRFGHPDQEAQLLGALLWLRRKQSETRKHNGNRSVEKMYFDLLFSILTFWNIFFSEF